MAAVGWWDRVTLDVEQVWAVLMTSGALIKGTFRIFSEKNKKVIKLSGARVDPCVSVCWPMFNQAGPGSGVRGVFPFSLWKSWLLHPVSRENAFQCPDLFLRCLLVS